MKHQHIAQFTFGIGLLSALIACQKNPFTPTMADILDGYEYSNFRLDYGSERWLAFDPVSVARLQEYHGINGGPYGFDLNGDGITDWNDLTNAATWIGGEIPVPIYPYTGFDVVFTASTQVVVTNLGPIQIGTLTIPPGTQWSLSKTLNDETEETADSGFVTFWMEPQIGGTRPRWWWCR
jgi:hypothetical protein